MQIESVLLSPQGKAVNYQAVKNQLDADGNYPPPDGLSLKQLIAIGYRVELVATQPDDYSPELYFRTEQGDAPFICYTKKPAEMLAQAEASKEADEAQRYLSATDYLFTGDRVEELRKDEPERYTAEKAARAKARDVIRAYRQKYPPPGGDGV